MKKFLIIIYTLLSAVTYGQNSFIRSSSGAFLMSGNSFLTTLYNSGSGLPYSSFGN